MTETDRNLARNTRWWEEHCRGTTIRTIAQREGVSPATVHAAIKLVRDSIPESERTEIRKDMHELYTHLMREALSIADMLPPPVVAGKDGLPVADPNNEGVTFYDYSGRLRALETAASMADRARKMFGVDEASRLIVDSSEDAAAQRLAAESAAYLAQQEASGDE